MGILQGQQEKDILWGLNENDYLKSFHTNQGGSATSKQGATANEAERKDCVYGGFRKG